MRAKKVVLPVLKAAAACGHVLRDRDQVFLRAQNLIYIRPHVIPHIVLSGDILIFLSASPL